MSEILYHYTDGVGLKGIIETRKLWCSHIGYLNDALEYKYGRILYRQMLEALAMDDSRSEVQRRFAETALFRLDDSNLTARNPGILADPRRYYAASFSTKGDDLSQWRGYGGGGPRFAIGFRRTELERLLELSGMRLAPVRYDDEMVSAEMLEMFLDATGTLASNWLAPKGRYTDPMAIHPPEIFDINAAITEAFCPLLKHAKFQEEAEWRLINDPKCERSMKGPPPCPRFRQGRSFLVPYIEVDIGQLDRPIESIVVGPTPHPDESRWSILRLLAFQPASPPRLVESSEQRVRVSGVPYRDW